MMNRFEETFKTLKQKQEGALSVFMTAGYPVLSSTSKLIISFERETLFFFNSNFAIISISRSLSK